MGLRWRTGRNKIEFTLRERIRQIRRLLTDKEKAKSYYSNQAWRQERVATGELIFTLKTYLGPGVTLEWRDGEHRLEIVDDRYDKGSLLITSQVPVSQWHDVIAEPKLS